MELVAKLAEQLSAQHLLLQDRVLIFARDICGDPLEAALWSLVDSAWCPSSVSSRLPLWMVSKDDLWDHLWGCRIDGRGRPACSKDALLLPSVVSLTSVDGCCCRLMETLYVCLPPLRCLVQADHAAWIQLP